MDKDYEEYKWQEFRSRKHTCKDSFLSRIGEESFGQVFGLIIGFPLAFKVLSLIRGYFTDISGGLVFFIGFLVIAVVLGSIFLLTMLIGNASQKADRRRYEEATEYNWRLYREIFPEREEDYRAHCEVDPER